jgi:tRNA(fMet)-specific endonuclease VapC
MSFLLDTNTCSYHLRRPAGLAHRFVQHQGRLFIPSIVLAELYVWVYRRDDPTRGVEAMDWFVRHEVQVLDFDQTCADKFGRVRADLLGKGISVDRFDLLIASVALVHDFTLVSHNTADFQNVPDLRLEDWLP